MNSGSVWEKENMDGINLGLTKMAESCPGTTRASLENMQAWFNLIFRRSEFSN